MTSDGTTSRDTSKYGKPSGQLLRPLKEMLPNDISRTAYPPNHAIRGVDGHFIWGSTEGAENRSSAFREVDQLNLQGPGLYHASLKLVWSVESADGSALTVPLSAVIVMSKTVEGLKEPTAPLTLLILAELVPATPVESTPK